MNNYSKLCDLLKDALNSDLTPLQKNIVLVNTAMNHDEFDTASFVVMNRIAIDMMTMRLAQFGSLLETFWSSIAVDKLDLYRDNSLELYRALCSYEREEKNDAMPDLEYLLNYGFTDEELATFTSNISFEAGHLFSENRKVVETNLLYLKDLGVTNCREIVQNYYELLMMDASTFIEIFNKYDREDLILKLEKNIAIMEYL